METRPGTEHGAAYEPTSKAPPATPSKASLIDDFIEIFYAPSTVFARRVAGGYGLHLLVITVIAALFAFANRSATSAIFDAEFHRSAAKALADNPKVTQDVIDKMRPIQEGLANVLQYIGTPIFIFVVGVLVWLVAKVASFKLTYQQAVLIVTLAWIPRLVQALLTTVQVLLMDTSNIAGMHSLTFSPARFMNPDTSQKQLLALASRIDLFTLWVTFLIGIGIAVAAKVSRRQGFAAAAGVWGIATVLTVLIAR